jgi:hypothetical protein
MRTLIVFRMSDILFDELSLTILQCILGHNHLSRGSDNFFVGSRWFVNESLTICEVSLLLNN